MPTSGPLIVAAPDSFKGTFPASAVARAIADGARLAGARAREVPLADGGDGTLDILHGSLGGEIVTARVRDPLGRPRPARFALLDGGGTAIVEMAQASGLARLAPAERGPEQAEHASTYGTGELIIAAARVGAARILVGVGGSATTDGGRGALEALDAAGGPSALGGAQLIVLCDVETQFERAAEVYAPQKGADAPAVRRLTARLHREATAMAAATGRDPRGHPRTGAAGGLSGALWAVAGAELVSGIDTILDLVGFERRLDGALAVVTGEGRLDEQTTEGKVIAGVVRAARRQRLAVHAVVGRSALPARDAEALGLASVREAPTLPAVTAATEQLVGRLIRRG